MDEVPAVRAPYVPVVWGTIAAWLGKKNAPGGSEHTHKWTVYVRHADDRDLSYAVSKVVFTLHPSIPNHVRGAPRSNDKRTAEPQRRRLSWKLLRLIVAHTSHLAPSVLGVAQS
jgi:hypothetical protein